MKVLTGDDILRVKSLGFLRNRGTDLFSGRIVPVGTVFSAENFKDLSYIAENFGNGKLICTSRQSVEVVGIPFDKIDEAIKYAEEHDLHFGGTGNKVRPVTACKGTTCVFGNTDTQELAQKIHNEFYIGWNNVKLPHKFKIAVGGCPNSCIKPSLNDFGVEAQRTKNGEDILFKIYVGGTWGKSTRMGTPLSRLVKAEELLPVLEKTILWFKENAYSKERLGMAIDRIGIKNLEQTVFSDEILARKDEILNNEILQKN